jgi:2-aminoethylphosphonate-pyruvate transaminase
VLLAGAADAVLMSGPTYAGDEVYIQAPDGLLQQMSKDRDELQSITGELVGISRVSFRLCETMREHAARAFEDTLHVAYETDSLVAAAAQLPVTCPLVEDLLWGEIDDKGHLERVRDQVYPAIERKDG